MVNINNNNFTILQYGKKHRMQKICSITKKLYYVDLSNYNFYRYYKPKKKYINHLLEYTEEELTFLYTTLTPEEVKSLSDEVKKNIKSSKWRFQIGQEDN